MGSLSFDDLKKMRVVLKRAAYFITCKGKYLPQLRMSPEGMYRSLITLDKRPRFSRGIQTSFLERSALPSGAMPLSNISENLLTKGVVS
jgi:hypothetical protein